MTKHRIFETGIARSWTPEQKVSQDKLNTVLEIVVELEQFSQQELVEACTERWPDLAAGTHASIASAGLLALKEAGLVAVVQEHRPTTWRII